MTSDELRALQRPIKGRYEDDPDAARITLEADGTLDEDVACSVRIGRALVKAGLHPGTGGDGTMACSGDMLLQALVACAGVTMRSVATSMGLNVAGSVHAEGDLDWRGTLAVDREAPSASRTSACASSSRATRATRSSRPSSGSPSAIASSSRRWPRRRRCR